MKSICFLIRFLLFSFLLNYTMTSTIRIWDHEKKHEAFFAHFECAPFSGIMRRGVERRANFLLDLGAPGIQEFAATGGDIQSIDDSDLFGGRGKIGQQKRTHPGDPLPGEQGNGGECAVRNGLGHLHGLVVGTTKADEVHGMNHVTLLFLARRAAVEPPLRDRYTSGTGATALCNRMEGVAIPVSHCQIYSGCRLLFQIATVRPSAPAPQWGWTHLPSDPGRVASQPDARRKARQ